MPCDCLKRCLQPVEHRYRIDSRVHDSSCREISSCVPIKSGRSLYNKLILVFPFLYECRVLSMKDLHSLDT